MRNISVITPAIGLLGISKEILFVILFPYQNVHQRKLQESYRPGEWGTRDMKSDTGHHIVTTEALYMERLGVKYLEAANEGM